MSTPPPPKALPAAFIGHGSPMNALELNDFTAAWRAFGQDVPRPRAILVASAHWYIDATAVISMDRPRTIHDFCGFPQALFDVHYAGPGLPELAGEVTEAVKPTAVLADGDSWGLDHGAWIILVHAFLDASIPVVQLSVNGVKDLSYHFELGRRLAPLRGSPESIRGRRMERGPGPEPPGQFVGDRALDAALGRGGSLCLPARLGPLGRDDPARPGAGVRESRGEARGRLGGA